jgi:hypothetical protein
MNRAKEDNQFAATFRLPIIFLFFFLLCCRSTCLATTVMLEWDSSADASGYKVYYQADSPTQPFTGTGAAEGTSPIVIQNQSTGKISATISGLDPSHAYYFAVTAYNASVGESTYSNIVYVPAFAANLSISFSGSGSGSINSSPSGIACELGTCSATFDIGSSVTLLATPSSNSTSLSYLSSWTGCTSTNGNSCTVAINTSTNVSATFSTHPPAHLANTNSYYSSLQTAFNNVANTGTIQAQAVQILGSLTTINKAITLMGGYNATYSGRSGFTVMNGTLTVGSGSLVVDNLVISN